MNVQRIAIVGGGPSGLTALKSVIEDGLNATLFEQSFSIGGQWNQQSQHSGVWENLQTNSSKYVTVFSDFPHRKNVQIYPGHRELLQYLKDYERKFELSPYIVLNTEVEKIEKSEDGNYRVSYSTQGKIKQTEVFTNVIIASGRFNNPNHPVFPGVDQFKGQKLHAFDYKRNSDFKGMRVLVIGNSISGLEISSNLAEDESISVVTSSRKPRYILNRVINGVPGDHLLFTRFRNFEAQAFTPSINGERFKEFVLKSCGNPADYGGLRPSENIFEAGISACQNYLSQVSNKKIFPKGSIKKFTEQGVIFDDGTEKKFDVVIFATGYTLHLPFLSKEIYSAISTGNIHLDLYKYTFHPDLPGMAFIGLYQQIGPKFPSFELQARWIAGCWSGNIPMANRQEMLTWILGFQKSSRFRTSFMSQEIILLFAQAAGVDPDLNNFPEIAASLIFGPLVPSQFRLQGHGKMANAKESFLANNASLVNELKDLPPNQLEELKTVAKLLEKNSSLRKLMLKEQLVE